jgi:MFS family permease
VRALPTAARGSEARKRLLLLLICLAQFMVILDVSIVNVALPSIRGGLHFGTTGLQWVVNAYTITFGGFLMLGGRTADLLGRRRVFLAGTALFSIASLLCAFAESRGLLIAARAMQGFGGAILSPASLSIITTSFAEGSERNRALGVWGAMAGLGGASGCSPRVSAGRRSSSSTHRSARRSFSRRDGWCRRVAGRTWRATSTSPARRS